MPVRSGQALFFRSSGLPLSRARFLFCACGAGRWGKGRRLECLRFLPSDRLNACLMSSGIGQNQISTRPGRLGSHCVPFPPGSCSREQAGLMAGYYIEKIVLLLKNWSCRSEFAQVLMQAAGFWSVSGASPLWTARSGQALFCLSSGLPLSRARFLFCACGAGRWGEGAVDRNVCFFFPLDRLNACFMASGIGQNQISTRPGRLGSHCVPFLPGSCSREQAGMKVGQHIENNVILLVSGFCRSEFA